MDMQTFDGAVTDILAVIPNRETDLARFVRLITAAAYPTITVIGKYNHGKSRLLNELIDMMFSRLPISVKPFILQNIFIKISVGWMRLG